jgi:iron-sulfur cluster assembly accessory protein
MSQTLTHGVLLTDNAQAKVKSLIEGEGRDDLRLRIEVESGGCSGMIYKLYFDDLIAENDAIKEFDGVEVVVDQMSIPYLDGATIDFEDTIQKQGFVIDNPNAQGSCACGDSFN